MREPSCSRRLATPGELLQGPAIAIRIAEVGKMAPVLHIDLTDVNASSGQFLADSPDIRDHHLQALLRSRLHVGNANPDGDRAGRTGRGQLHETQTFSNRHIVISVKADLLRIKSLCAVNVGDRY